MEYLDFALSGNFGGRSWGSGRCWFKDTFLFFCEVGFQIVQSVWIVTSCYINSFERLSFKKPATSCLYRMVSYGLHPNQWTPETWENHLLGPGNHEIMFPGYRFPKKCHEIHWKRNDGFSCWLGRHFNFNQCVQLTVFGVFCFELFLYSHWGCSIGWFFLKDL